MATTWHAQCLSGLMHLTLRSPAFSNYGSIPQRHTCEGADSSPPLAVSLLDGDRARSLALIVDDPDAPHEPWVHWIIYNIPPTTTFLAEGLAENSLPAGARFGMNSWNRVGWGGPCPPRGSHRYVFTLYALDVVLPNLGAPTKRTLLSAMARHVLAHTQLVGTYALRRPSWPEATKS